MQGQSGGGEGRGEEERGGAPQPPAAPTALVSHLLASSVERTHC